MRMLALLMLLVVMVSTACGGNGSAIGDRRCSDDAECREDEKCVLVTSVLVSTGDCLASSGVNVCRKVCASAADSKPCGCQ